MTRRVFLHVGLPKSGTTYLQAILLKNKQALADAGLSFPGQDGWRDQVRAVRDVREMPHALPRHRREVPGSWDELAHEMNAWRGDSVVSMEWLSRVEPHQLRRILDSLASSEVHVVFTIRDLGRTLPASWQESVVNRQVWTWSEFLAETSDETLSGEDRKFWRLHDILALVERWRIEVPVERIHVVTVPPPGAAPETLWDRFAGVLGVTEVPVLTDDVRRNDGLALVSTEVLRRVNARSREAEIAPGDHKRIFSRQLARQGLSELRRGQRPVIPPELHPWVLFRMEAQVEGLRRLGVHVVGDLADLRPDLSKHLEQPPEPEAEDMLDVALDSLVIMARQRAEVEALAVAVKAELSEEIERLQRRMEKLQRRQAESQATARRFRERPLRAALGLQVRRSRVLGGLLRRLRGGRRTKR